MARGSSLLLQPYSSESAMSLSLVPSSRALKLLDTYTCGQANSVLGCAKHRLDLLRKKQVIDYSSREFSAASVAINNSFGQSNSSGNNGGIWRMFTRLESVSRVGMYMLKGENWRWSIRAVGNCQVESGPEIVDHINKPDEAGRLFIFGFGFTSYALAVDLRNKNWYITGTCRTCEVESRLHSCGFHSFLFNSENDGEELKDSGLQELLQASHWLVSIPPVGDFDKDPVLAVHRQDLIQAAARGNVRWIGYLSSTGVYGDWQGEWVDEDTQPRPSESKAVARLAAEKDWLNFGEVHGVAVQVFRLGGIYGAGRNAFSTILQSRTRSRLQRERRRFTSRIHVADVCQVLTASMENPCPGRIYNLVDDDPAPRKEVFAFARDLLGHQVRDTEAAAKEYIRGSPFSFTQCDEKRVSNRRIKQELQIQLLHPSYKSGLREILMNSSPTESNASYFRHHPAHD